MGGGERLFAIKADGTKKWEFLTVGIVCCSPAIGSDGTIYFLNKIFWPFPRPEGTKRL